MSIAVVVPSKTPSNLLPCLRAVGNSEPGIRRIVVDDGIGLSLTGSERFKQFDGAYEWVVKGISPFVYARNCNLGITAALNNPHCDGVVLLNDDAILQTPGGFSVMAQACREHPEYGLIGATTKVVGNRNQFPQGVGLRDEPRMVCFVCVYIPRSTIERVGLLDERYTGYGLDDDDYSFEVRKAGLKIGIHDGCYVDHGSLRSSFRGDPRTPANFQPNLRRFIAKWGHDNFGRPATV
jgi:GT2 family glycosyltransferase